MPKETHISTETHLDSGVPAVERTGQRSVLDHLRKVAARGPVTGQDLHHGGIHGTSLETIQHLIMTGEMPGRTVGLDGNYEPGDISFYPTRGLLDTVLDTRDEAIIRQAHSGGKEVAYYAEGNAREYGLVKLLGYSLYDEGAYQAAIELQIDGHYAYFLERGHSQEELEEAVLASDQRKGFILGFSPDIREFRLLLGDNKEGDMRIRRDQKSQRKPFYHYISGIEARGPIEQAFLDQITLTEPHKDGVHLADNQIQVSTHGPGQGEMQLAPQSPRIGRNEREEDERAR